MSSGLKYRAESTPDIVVPNPGQYIVALYDRKLYVGNVIEILAEYMDAQVNFMRTCGLVAKPT